MRVFTECQNSSTKIGDFCTVRWKSPLLWSGDRGQLKKSENSVQKSCCALGGSPVGGSRAKYADGRLSRFAKIHQVYFRADYWYSCDVDSCVVG